MKNYLEVNIKTYGKNITEKELDLPYKNDIESKPLWKPFYSQPILNTQHILLL